MSHLLEIFLQLLSFFPPWRSSGRDNSQMARIGNFFGAFFYVFLAFLAIFALAQYILF